jgi:hypothetical protein
VVDGGGTAILSPGLPMAFMRGQRGVSGGEDGSIVALPVGTKASALVGGERGDHDQVWFFAGEF